jgi:hypothetical protein
MAKILLSGVETLNLDLMVSVPFHDQHPGIFSPWTARRVGCGSSRMRAGGGRRVESGRKISLGIFCPWV